MKPVNRKLWIVLGAVLLALLSVQSAYAAFSISVTTDPSPLVEGQPQTITISTGAPFQVSCTFGITINGPGEGSAAVSLTQGSYAIQCSNADGTEISNVVTITVAAPGPTPTPTNTPGQGDTPTPTDDGTTTPTGTPPGIPLCHLRSSTGSNVNVRANRSLDGDILTRIDGNTSYEITGQDQSGGWYRVRANGFEGWVIAPEVNTNIVLGCDIPNVPNGPDLSNCDNGDELTAWVETLPAFTQELLAGSANVCDTATTYFEADNAPAVNVADDVLRAMGQSCPAEAISLINALDELRPSDRLQVNRALAGDPDNACENWRSLPEFEDVLLPACRVEPDDWNKVGEEALGITEAEKSGDRGCRIYQLLRLLGNQLNDDQLSVYRALTNQPVCGLSNLGALEEMVWLEATDRFSAVYARPRTTNPTKFVQESDCNFDDIAPGQAVPELPPALAECPVELRHLLVNFLNERAQAEGEEKLDPDVEITRIINDPSGDPCAGMLAYLRRQVNDGTDPAPRSIPVLPEDPNKEELIEFLGEWRIVYFPPDSDPLAAFISRELEEDFPQAGKVIRSGQESTTTIESNVDQVLFPTISLDGNRVAYLAVEEGRTVVRSRSFGQPVIIMLDLAQIEGYEGWEIVQAPVAWAPDNTSLLVTLRNPEGEEGIYILAAPNDLVEQRLIFGRGAFVSPFVKEGSDQYVIAYEAQMGSGTSVFTRGLNTETLMVTPSRLELNAQLNDSLSCRQPSISEKTLFAYFECDTEEGRKFYQISITRPEDGPQELLFVEDEVPADVDVANFQNMAAGPVENWLAFDDGEKIHLVKLDGTRLVDYKVSLFFPRERLSNVYWRNDSANDDD